MERPSTPRLLACDGALGSLSLACGTQVVAADGNDALERGLALIDQLLADCGLTLAELDGLACTIGPGRFTGLRITLALFKGLALATGLPLIPVSSFDVVRELASTAPQPEMAELLALQPRSGVVSLQLCAADGTVRRQLTDSQERTFAELRDDIAQLAPRLLAWPVDATAELARESGGLTVLPLRDEQPASAVLRLANLRWPGLDRTTHTIHGIIADYGEMPATTMPVR